MIPDISRLCFFLSIFTLSASLQAQDFNPFPDGRELTLLEDDSDDNFVYVRVDSTTTEGGNQILWFNKVVKPGSDPGCDWLVDQAGFFGEKVIIRPDSMYIFLNKSGDSIFYYRNHQFDSWRLYTYDDGSYIEGQPWIFVNQSLMPMYPDSVRIIQLVAKTIGGANDPANPWHLKRIGLSEDNGIYRWVNMNDFPDTPTVNDFFWQGISDPDTGWVNQDASSTFDLLKGDEFHFEYETLEGTGSDYWSVFTRGKRFVMDRELSVDETELTVTFFEILQTFDTLWSLGTATGEETLTVDTIVEVIKFADYSYLNKFPGEYFPIDKHGFSQQYSDTIFFDRSFKEVYDWFDISIDGVCLENGALSDSMPEMTFIDGLGLFHFLQVNDVLLSNGKNTFERYDMVYYQKRLEQWGTPFDFDALFNGLEAIEDFELNIYPNPTQQTLIIEADLANGQLILTDLSGRLLIEQQFNYNTTLNLSDLNAGMYLVRITNGSASVSSRIIKTN